MQFKDLIGPQNIIGNLESTAKNEVLAEMVDALIASGSIPEDIRQGVLTALIEREHITSTGVGSGIAVPHAKHPAIKKMTGLFARSKEGVNFGSIDDKPVHIFVVLLSNQDLIQQHLQSLAYVAKHLHEEIFRSFLINARDAKEIEKLLEEADQKSGS